jgi:mycothiol synthase
MGQQLPQLEMELDSLEGLPEVVAPAGYRLRSYREGDAAEWCRLIRENIGGEYDERAFRESTAASGGFDAKGLFFAEQEGRIVGTACGVWRREYGERTGYLHMVAVDPQHQGRGLGRALTLAVLHRLRERGYRRAVLETDDWRLPALRLYLSLGFRPRISHQSHEQRWREVYRRLGRQSECRLPGSPS